MLFILCYVIALAKKIKEETFFCCFFFDFERFNFVCEH